MLTREDIEVVLERIRPFMRADGADIELIDVWGALRRGQVDGHVRRLSERPHDALRRCRSGDPRSSSGI
jgi:hypothetical protein